MAIKLQFGESRVWRSDPAGLVVVADAECAYVETPRQRLVQMARQRPDHLAVMDVAVVSNVTPAGPQTAVITLDQADGWARKMKINTPDGPIPLGNVLVDAWAAHQELYRRARDAASVVGGG